jgi:hypothetical protein
MIVRMKAGGLVPASCICQSESITMRVGYGRDESSTDIDEHI